MRWPWTRPDPEPAEVLASAAPGWHASGPLTAAAAIGSIGAPAGRGSLRRRAQEWQGEAWDHVDVISPLGSAVDYTANGVAKVRVFPVVELAPDEPPVPIDSEDAGVPASVVESALACWALFRDPEGGQAELLRAHARHFTIAGECALVGVPASLDDPLGAETWQIRNIELVRQQGIGASAYYEARDSTSRPWKRLPEGAYVARMIQRHDRFPSLADSPLRRLIPDCDEFILHSLAIAAETRSRVPSGIVKWPDGLSIVTPAGIVTPSDPVQVVIDAMTTAISDPGDQASLVPVFVKGTSDALREMGKLDLSRVTSTDHRGLRKDSLERIAQGGPWPPELVLGLGETNRWNANVITNAIYDQYMDPLLVRMLAALAATYLRPRMLADAQPTEWVARIGLGFDASGVTSNPAQVENAIKAWDRGLIKDSSARRALDFTEDDAPDDEELAAWVERQRVTAGPRATRVSPLDPESTVTASVAPARRAPRPPRALPRKAPAALPAGRPQGRPALPAAPPWYSELTAAATPDALALARRLAAIDAGLRERLRVAGDAAVHRMLDRAGARLRNRLARDATASAAIKGVPNAHVASVLGRPLVAAAVDEQELVEGAWDGLRDKFYEWTATARRQALRSVAPAVGATRDDLEAESDAEFTQARDEAWAWLAAALTALALAALYDPDPSAPPAGETDVSLLIPQALVREAVARAGGDAVVREGDGLLAAGGERPAGGVATGQTVIDLFRDHGQVVAAWGWDYGDPSSRSRPFPPHEALDGVLFSTWTDEALANGEDFPEGAYFFPGDHDGCACNVIAVFGPAGDAPDDDSGDDDAPVGLAASAADAR